VQLYLHSPNTPSWRGAWLSTWRNFTFLPLSMHRLHKTSNWRLGVNNGLERMSGIVMAYFEVLSNIFLEGLRNPRKNSVWIFGVMGRDSKPGIPEHKARTATTNHKILKCHELCSLSQSCMCTNRSAGNKHSHVTPSKITATQFCHLAEHIRGCIQKFPDWPSGARTANGTALCH
jgi:hypothetical protein